MYDFVNLAFVTLMETLNVFAIGGPQWYEDVTMMARVTSRTNVRDFLGGGWGTRLLNVSLKSIYHYAQNSQENRF